MEDNNAASAAPDTSAAGSAEPSNAVESLDSVLDSAFEAVERGEAEEGRAEQPREANGRWSAREAEAQAQQPAQASQDQTQQPAQQPSQQSGTDVPTRFSDDAKAAWATVPDPVKYEINRTIRELEGGIQQYREAFEPLRGYDAEARQNGTSIPEVLGRFKDIAEGLRAPDLNTRLQYIDRMCRHAGTDLATLAAAINGQKPDDVQRAHANEVAGLRQQIVALQQQVGGVSSTIAGQQRAAVESYITEQAAQLPRLEELSQEITFLLETGRAGDLAEAYQLAERINPAPAPIQTAPANRAQTPGMAPAQTRPGKAGLSVTGAPGSGSNPAYRKPAASLDEALDNALALSGF